MGYVWWRPSAGGHGEADICACTHCIRMVLEQKGSAPDVKIPKIFTHIRFHRESGLKGGAVILLVLLYPVQPDDMVCSRHPRGSFT